MNLRHLQTVKIENSSKKALRIRNFSLYAQSPLRYPGGKTWFTKFSNMWLAMQSQRNLTLVEPFAGGASVSLAALRSDLVEKVHIAETDPGVSALWKILIDGKGPNLADKILSFVPTKKNVVKIVDDNPSKRIDLAFRTLIKNRFSFGGILAEGAGFPKKGELDKGLTQRWYPETLANRLGFVHQVRGRIEFFDGCGADLVKATRRRKNAVLFLDPPYIQDGRNAGKRIYNRKEICVYGLVDELCDFSPRFLLTYHLSREVALRATRANLDLSLVPMKSSHHLVHHEMVVTNDPAWELVASWTNK